MFPNPLAFQSETGEPMSTDEKRKYELVNYCAQREYRFWWVYKLGGLSITVDGVVYGRGQLLDICGDTVVHLVNNTLPMW